jgi:hypothetical protein
MKCKTGDLAFIKKAVRKENIGRIITCIKHLGHYKQGATIIINGEQWVAIGTDDFWLIQGNIETMYGSAKQSYIPDSWLSPIKPLLDDEEDEADTPLITDLELLE